MSEAPENFVIWEGVLPAFPKAGGADTFADPQIVARIAAQAECEAESVGQGKPVRDISVFNQYPLPGLLAVLSTAKPLTVLDFGGGIGRTYLSVRATAAHPQRIRFYVVELGGLAKAGRALFAGDPQINFIESIDAAPRAVDVVHAGSAFHYVDDWKGLLRRFAGLGPDYIAFGNLLAGDIEPYVTMQNYWGHKIPVRFHNFDAVMSELKGLGFELVFDAFHEQMLLGKRQPLPLDHFPENRRLIYGRNVILKRLGGDSR